MTIPRDLILFTAAAIALAAAPAFATCKYGGTYPDCKDKPKDPPPVVEPQPEPQPQPEPTQPTGPAPQPTQPEGDEKERKDYVPRMRKYCPEPKKNRSLITDQTYEAGKFDIAPQERCCVRAYSWREAKQICEGRK